MDIILFAGRAGRTLAGGIAAALDLTVGRSVLEEFPDGEIHVEIEEEVRGRDVFLVQSTCAPVGRNLLEILLLADGCRRRGAVRVTAVIPYFGYARQDRRVTGKEPIGARVVAELLATRIDRVLTVDLHNPAIEGFFGIPLDHVSAVPLLAEAFLSHRSEESVLVAPDLGAAKLVQRYADLLRLPVAYAHKIRHGGDSVTVREISGEVRDRRPVVVDDMISTGGTMASAIEALLEKGARPEVTVIASHGLLAGDARERLAALPIRRIITTDSVPRGENLGLPLEVLSLRQLLAERIVELHRGFVPQN